LKTKAKNLIIRTKRAVFSEYLANHPSLFDGDGLDFSELREYVSGEDAKRIDHKTSAKKQKPYIKVYKSERELNIAVFSLLCGSIYFGTKMQKQELVAQILSIIGVSAIRYQDRFSSYIFTDKIESFVKPSKKLSFVTKAVEDVLNFYPIGKSLNLKNLEDEIKRHIKKRSIIFLIGDFFDYVELKKLNTKHEVIVIIVRDRFEEELSDISMINLIDASTKKTLFVDIDSKLIKEYNKKIKEQDHLLYEKLKRDKIKFVKIYTDENPIKNLKKLFMGKR
jgi:uncharacterized protein (DUF58 family)